MEWQVQLSAPMKRVSPVKYFWVTSRTVLASRPVAGMVKAREWVILERTSRGWRGYFGDECASQEIAVLEGLAFPNHLTLWESLHNELLEHRSDVPEWSQVHAALGDRGTMWLAFARGRKDVVAASRVLPLDAVVAEACRRRQADLVYELCTGRSPEELIPILASDDAKARLIAQLALGVSE